MKRIFTILLLLVGLGCYAQSYNNEWIDYSKTYYKFKVGTTGLYRIPQSVLAGASMGSVPAQNFQLFRNGKEVPIYTSVASGVLGSSDYIEFWGQTNDGAADLPLYRDPTYQHTDHWSLETDTAVYFLTYNNTGSSFHYINTVNDATGTSLTAEPYFMHTTGSYFKDGGINPGFAQIVGEYIYSSSYDLGEFWATSFIYPGTPYTDNQSNLYTYTGGPAATLSFGLTGCADNNRNVRVSLNNSLVIDTVMNSFYDLKSSRSVPVSLLSSNAASVAFTNNCSNSTDRVVASYYELNYPRQFNFGGQSNFSFQLPAKSAGYLLKITNFNISGSATPVLYDLTNGLRYTAVIESGSTLSFLLAGSASARKLVLVNEDPSTVTAVSTLTSRTFVNYASTANQGNYVIISHPMLYTGTTGNNPVADYKSYRGSVAGGGFNPQIYDIDELVDQFAFGIKKHPLSVQNFLRYARAVFSAKPQYVLLIGHGMTYNDYFYYSEQAHDPLADKLNIIPAYGYPASDNKLSAANATDAVPVTPIGRLSVVSGAEIEIYLSKLKEYEQAQANSPNTIDGRLWMKNVLHLTGGSEPYLGTILCNYMYVYAGILADTLFGANVYTLCDGNAGTVNQVPGGIITNLFNSGFSILNYFGHSSNTTLGYNLDNPQAYNNQGKYPIFFLNGCDAGDFFVYDATRQSSTKTISENYVLAKERGAIAVVASTHFGIVNYLNILLYGLYNAMSNTDYGKSVGITQKDALQSLVNAASGDYFARLHAEEMTIHGDPAIKINGQDPLPDYDVETSQLVINPSFISVADNSFTLNAKFYNLGKATKDSITLQVTRKYPDGSTAIILTKKIKPFYYSDSISLSIPILPTRDKGQNYVTISLNSDNAFSEVTMSNNTSTASVYIYEDEANPVYPYNYAILNTNTSKLYASTADPFSVSSQYAMEFDSTALFNSPLKVSKTVTSAGGLLEFDPGVTFADSVVYYWRVSKVPGTGGTYKWNDFSFVYIDPAHSSTGFNQSHFYQHTQSTLNGLLLDSASRRLNFAKIDNVLLAKCGVFPSSASSAQDISVVINGDPTKIESVCGVGEILITVFSPYTFQPWYNAPTGSPGRYGSVSPCGPTRENYFIYDIMDTASRRAMVNFLDIIPNDFYVVVYNCSYTDPSYNTYASTWKGDTSYLGSGNSIYARLFDQGFTTIDSFYKPRAFIFMYQKNNPANFAPRSVFSQDINDKISLSANYRTVDTVGYLTSPQFGPAKKWKDLHWRGGSLESPSSDSAKLQVIGIDTSGNSTVLYTLSYANQDFDISGVDPKLYRYIQLKMRLTDTAAGTPYQLKYWRVNYDGVPEGALAPNIYVQAKDTLELGEKMNFAIAFKNVSPLAFDSVALKMTITDKSNVAHVISLPKKKPLVSGDTLTVAYQFDTKDYGGSNTMYLNVNPDFDQPEQYQFNNFLYKKFYVASESRNPLLDVTFDNVHILNNDIVSAKPHIQVKLKSQSQYVLLTDTSLIKVQLKYPDGTIRTMSFNSDTMRFTPASSGSDNTATVDFTPVFTKQYNANGDNYELIVTGKDELGNTAGSTPYRVSFTIITKAMISNLLNYPNPFTTSTAFVFTITGSEVPQNIKIQILTITGKIVREITKDELGPLHIGRNITEFKWDGKDMYGSRLANGVYLYHVVTNLNGKSLDKYKASGDNTDKYFNNGYGKMYLMK